MSQDLNAKQRLAISRTMLVEALRDPVWLILLQRVLKEKATPRSSVPSKRT